MRVEQWDRYETEEHRVQTLIRLKLTVEGEEGPYRRGIREKLSILGVGKQFRVGGRALDVLANVSLAITEGEFVCLVGPSGCGKSTLLNIIAGLEKPSAGRVLADGRPVAGVGADRILMFQEPALFPWLTVRENVEFGLKLRGYTREERVSRAMEALRLVGLADFARSFVHQLSGGMKQRAALARALVLDPGILLLDEPFAALDAQSRDVLHGELLEIWSRTGKTIVFVTHNVPEALRLADRIVVFSARPGRVIGEFPVKMPRPRQVEQGALCEIGEAIRGELRATLSFPAEGGGAGARQLQEGPLLLGVDRPLGTRG